MGVDGWLQREDGVGKGAWRIDVMRWIPIFVYVYLPFPYSRHALICTYFSIARKQFIYWNQ